MKKFFFGAALAMALIHQAAPASAATWNVNFSFGSPTETVTGTIVTDCDSCFLQQADVSSWSLTFSGLIAGSASSGPGNQSPPLIVGNVLDATGGKLLYVFDSVNSGASALFTDFASAAQLEFGFNFPQGVIHVQDNAFNSILAPVTQPFQIATEVVSTVPLPATLPLFATGLAGLGLIGWRRKKAAAG